MKIGVPKEIKQGEYRVGMTPNSVKECVINGHEVFVEKGAGNGIECFDKDYEQAGARILPSAKEIYAQAEMIVKVKEPQPSECAMIRENQILFTYLHLAPDPELTHALIKSKCIGIAYETVTDERGGLPLLTPMSEVAGRLSIQAGARSLEKTYGGRGILLSGVPGVARGNVVVIGGGVVGTNALRMAIGMEAHVVVLDRSVKRLQELNSMFGAKLETLYATKASIEEYVKKADLVIGAVLVPGRAAPKLISKELLKEMKPGSVIVDVAIDQGGCVETSHATTHENPTYIVDNVVHYCVANMPGAVPRTSTFALNNATLPFIITIANKGVKQALTDDPHLMNGLNIYKGMVTYEPVAVDLNLKYTPAQAVLN